MTSADFLDRKYAELRIIYEEFVNKDKVTVGEKTEFLNNAFNCINVMNKLIALAANGNAAENQVTLSESKDNELNKTDGAPKQLNEVDKEAAQKSVEEISTQLENVLSQNQDAIDRGNKFNELIRRIDERSITDEEIIKVELDAYKLSPRLAGYKNMLKIPAVINKHPEFNNKTSYDIIVNALAKECGITADRLIKNINTIISKADFNNTIIIPIFRGMVNNNEKISFKLFISEFIDLFMPDSEDNNDDKSET